MSLTVFKNISELFTFEGILRKEGRSVDEKDMTRQKNAALVVYKGKVIWAGPEKKLSKEKLKKYGGIKKAKTVDLEGRTVLPSFIESHTHLVFGGDRTEEFEERIRGLSYEELSRRGRGILSTVRSTRKTSEKELYQRAQERVNRYIRQGVTTIEVKSGYGLNAKTEIKMLRVAKALKKARICSTFLGLHAIPPEVQDPEDYFNETLEKTLPQVVQEGLAERVDIFIEKGFYTPAHAEKLFNKANELGLKICAHTEQLNPTGGWKELIKANALSGDHLIQLTDNEVHEIAQSGLTCVLLPAADFYLRMDYPPARKLINQGGRVALASDFNPGSSPTQDISFIGLLARLQMRMTLPEVYSAYTVGAAFALGFEQNVGALKPAYSADFVVLDDDWDQFFYQVGYHPIHSVWKNGRRLSRGS